MRRLITVLLAAMFLASAQAVEQPKAPPERPSYPVLTMRGLEDLRLGAVVPTTSSFPGLTYKTFQEEDWDEGKRVMRTTLKLYQNGYYLGRALVDNEARLVEFEFVDWRVVYESDFAPGSSWQQIRSKLSDAKLHYAYLLDALVAESPDLPGLQVHFSTQDYRAQNKLQGEFTPLNPSELPPNSKANKVRLFWIPPE